MAAPESTIWDLEPHTRAKHEILHRYLQAWIPILGRGGFRQVLYIDGFAGPGRYSKGESGSPVLALRALLEQSVALPATFLFLFVEKDPSRAQMLTSIVDDIELPEKLRVKIAAGETFESAYAELSDFYEQRETRWPPTFAFIDPFGWAGAPFSAVKEILGRSSSEVLITFMYEEINRFIGNPNQGENFDAFFGTSDWRDGISLVGPKERNRFLHDIYMDQLSNDAGAQYVRSFEMRNGRDVTDYFLFYATNNLLGMKRMKESMWKVDESGEFTFSDATNPDQLVLFGNNPQFDILNKLISDRFAGSVVTVGEVEDFVVAETAFRETHYKTQVLKPMETAELPSIVPVDPPPTRRPGTYADRNLKLEFLPSQP